MTDSTFISDGMIERYTGVNNILDRQLPALGKYMLHLFQGGAADTSEYTGIPNSMGNLAISDPFFMNAGENMSLCWVFTSEPGNGNFAAAGILRPLDGGDDIDIFRSVVPAGYSKTFTSSQDWSVGTAACPADGMYQIILTASNPTYIGNYSLVVDMRPDVAVSSVRLTSITLDPENYDGRTTNAPGAWSTNTGDPLSQIGVMVDRVFLNEGADESFLGEISIPLKYGINTFTLIGTEYFPYNEFYGGILFFDGQQTPPQSAVYNSNGLLSSFLVQPYFTEIMGGANGGLFFDTAPGTSVYTASDGTKVEVVGFTINSSCSETDRVSHYEIGPDGTPDTTAQLILNVTAEQPPELGRGNGIGNGNGNGNGNGRGIGSFMRRPKP